MIKVGCDDSSNMQLIDNHKDMHVSLCNLVSTSQVTTDWNLTQGNEQNNRSRGS